MRTQVWIGAVVLSISGIARAEAPQGGNPEAAAAHLLARQLGQQLIDTRDLLAGEEARVLALTEANQEIGAAFGNGEMRKRAAFEALRFNRKEIADGNDRIRKYSARETDLERELQRNFEILKQEGFDPERVLPALFADLERQADETVKSSAPAAGTTWVVVSPANDRAE